MPGGETPVDRGRMGMGAHTDYGIVTVLWADRVPGLQILDEASASCARSTSTAHRTC
ncbi:2OG-Fe(II) oxygenase family protein [Streptomyces sp. NPDC059398]|uniref:2OG-Fe(II) oxygenase family protein n=1 Tax=Streptomyces sp. NPDC059398 TaxID=3346820 RepID=UPI0036810A85